MHQCSMYTNKVTAPSQTLGDASFQQSLHERLGGLGRPTVQPQGAVKNVLKHLYPSLAIKWRLQEAVTKRAKVKMLQEVTGNKWRHFQLYSPARTASHRARPPDPTSPLRDCMGCLSAPLEPGTLESHKRYAWCHLQSPLLYRVQSQSAPHDPRCPAGCSPVWGLWQRHWDIIKKLKKYNNKAVVISMLLLTGVKDWFWMELVPVNNAEGMQVAQCQSNLRCVEHSPGLRKGALPLEVVEKLRTWQMLDRKHWFLLCM